MAKKFKTKYTVYADIMYTEGHLKGLHMQDAWMVTYGDRDLAFSVARSIDHMYNTREEQPAIVTKDRYRYVSKSRVTMEVPVEVSR